MTNPIRADTTDQIEVSRGGQRAERQRLEVCLLSKEQIGERPHELAPLFALNPLTLQAWRQPCTPWPGSSASRRLDKDELTWGGQ